MEGEEETDNVGARQVEEEGNRRQQGGWTGDRNESTGVSVAIHREGEMGVSGSGTRNGATIGRGYVNEMLGVDNDEGMGRSDGDNVPEDTGRTVERRPMVRRVVRLPVSSGNVRTLALPNDRTRHMEGGVIGK
jgi:hypothetical protein